MENWDDYFIKMAKLVATKSKDPSTQCGCVIVAADNSVLSTGYNGLPRGMEYSPEKLERPFKYKVMVHSEQNAIFNAARNGIRLQGGTAYITDIPCHECARGLVQCGIVRIVVPIPSKLRLRQDWQQSFFASKQIMEECGVELSEIEDERRRDARSTGRRT